LPRARLRLDRSAVAGIVPVLPHTIPGRRGAARGAGPPDPLLPRRLAGALPAPLRRGAGRRDGSARPPPPSAGGPLAAGRPWPGGLPGGRRLTDHRTAPQRADQPGGDRARGPAL